MTPYEKRIREAKTDSEFFDLQTEIMRDWHGANSRLEACEDELLHLNDLCELMAERIEDIRRENEHDCPPHIMFL